MLAYSSLKRIVASEALAQVAWVSSAFVETSTKPSTGVPVVSIGATSGGSRGMLPLCSMCVRGYNEGKLKPKELKCGHTFCAACLAAHGAHRLEGEGSTKEEPPKV